MNIHISNLPHSTNEAELRKMFQAFGQVTSVTLIKDKLTGTSRGLAFIEMPSKTQAQAAIRNLGNKELQGQKLKVSEAHPHPRER